VITFTRKALREWAKAKTEGANVGIANSYYSCPIAQYIADSGGESPIVGVRIRYCIDGRRYSRKMPDTLSTVVDSVDQIGTNKVVSREQLLTILGG
jgi:hypothetical protein